MPKINLSILVTTILAGVVVLLIQEFAFERKLNSTTGVIDSNLKGTN